MKALNLRRCDSRSSLTPFSLESLWSVSIIFFDKVSEKTAAIVAGMACNAITGTVARGMIHRYTTSPAKAYRTAGMNRLNVITRKMIAQTKRLDSSFPTQPCRSLSKDEGDFSSSSSVSVLEYGGLVIFM